MTTAPTSQSGDTRLDLDSTLHHWGAPIIQGSRWVGCRLDDAGPWCVAPVRRQPAAPPPDGIERRSRERITLELAGLCLGLVDQPPVVSRPRLTEPDALAELVRQPSVIAHEVANPLTAALASLDLSLDLIRTTASLTPASGRSCSVSSRAWGKAWSRPSSSCARFRIVPGEGWPDRSGSTPLRWCGPAW